MVGRPIVGDIRVQEILNPNGRRGYTILHEDGSVYRDPNGFLRQHRVGTARTYAYLLVDHLRWLKSEGLSADTVKIQDLKNYMSAIGAEAKGPFGLPWRVGKTPYKQATLVTAAASIKGFYIYQGTQGLNTEICESLKTSRLPTRMDRKRMFLGHLATTIEANPIAPSRTIGSRHPKLPPEDARAKLLEVVNSDRDRMAITWLSDGGLRVGELCGLYLTDLHLRENANCGLCSTPHVHICHRDDNVNQARAKGTYQWTADRDSVTDGGLIRRVSPAMIHTYFDYITREYPVGSGHGMLFVQLHGVNAGNPWSTAAVRGMLKRASARAGIRSVNPHSFRHQFATDILEAPGSNSVIARDAGGWQSATTVEDIYGHTDIHDDRFNSALDYVWRKHE